MGRGGTRQLVGVAILALCGAVWLTACGEDGDSLSGEDGGGEERSTAGDADAAPVIAGQALPQLPEGEPLQEDRQVIYTADIVVSVDEVDQATDQAVAIVEDAGGVVFSQTSDLEGEQETNLTLKVPPDELDDVIEQLEGLGKALQSDLGSDDVTEQVVDLDGRLATARASADRLRGLLAEAQTTTDVVAIEAELARREAEVESLEGQLRVLTSQVDMATVNLRLTEKTELEVSNDLPGFLESLRTGGVVLANIGLLLLAVVGFSLPFLPFLALGFWLVRRYLRNRPPRPQPAWATAPTASRPPLPPAPTQPPGQAPIE